MKKAFLFGISGKMGKMLVQCAPSFGYEITGGFDAFPHPEIPTF